MNRIPSPFRHQSLVRGLAIERPVRTMAIVVVLPVAQLLVEQVSVVAYGALVEQLVELLVVYTM